jgi:hypothetical protein
VELPGGVIAYTSQDRLFTYGLLALFMGATLALVVSGHVAGNLALSQGMARATAPSDGLGSALAAMLRGALPPSADLLVSLGSGAMAPLLAALAAALGPNSTVNLPAMTSNLRCVNATFAGLPSGAAAAALLSDVAGALGTISVSAQGMKATLLSLLGSGAVARADGGRLPLLVIGASPSPAPAAAAPRASAG